MRKKTNETKAENKGFDEQIISEIKADNFDFTGISEVKSTSKKGVPYVTLKGYIGDYPVTFNVYGSSGKSSGMREIS